MSVMMMMMMMMMKGPHLGAVDGLGGDPTAEEDRAHNAQTHSPPPAVQLFTTCCSTNAPHCVTEQVGTQPPTSADSVALPAFAAARRAAAAERRPCAIDRYLLPTGPTAANPPQRFYMLSVYVDGKVSMVFNRNCLQK